MKFAALNYAFLFVIELILLIIAILAYRQGSLNVVVLIALTMVIIWFGDYYVTRNMEGKKVMRRIDTVLSILFLVTGTLQYIFGSWLGVFVSILGLFSTSTRLYGNSHFQELNVVEDKNENALPKHKIRTAKRRRK